MNELKSHFKLDHRQRNGILLLVLFVIVSWGVYFLISPAQENYSNALTDEQLKNFEAQIDAIQRERDSLSHSKLYPFNPNYITDYKGYTLGMKVEEIDRLLRFRESGKWINSAQDFQKVTGVSDSLLNQISPYFKFPDWVTNPKPRKTSFNVSEKAVVNLKSDLNSASFEEILSIESLDPAIAKRIIEYRKKLGGFLDDRQLYDVYGISKEQVRQLQNVYTVLSKPNINILNVNTASASDLSTVPFITFQLAREIVNYRLLHTQINDLDELLKIEGITPYKLDRIKLYLSTNQN